MVGGTRRPVVPPTAQIFASAVHWTHAASFEPVQGVPIEILLANLEFIGTKRLSFLNEEKIPFTIRTVETRR